jgi:hypothetical protein
MATTPGDRTRGAEASRAFTGPSRERRSTETKSAYKTTELIVYVAFIAALFIAGAILDEADAGGLGGKQVWLYGSIVTAAYLISRGLAKSGSRDPYWDEQDNNGRGRS